MPDPSLQFRLAMRNELKGAFTELRSNLKSTMAGTLDLKKAFLGVGAAIGVGFGARELFRFGTESVKAFMDAERAAVGLNAALRVSGQLSEANSRAIIEHAAALQRVTTAEDDALVQVSATVAQLATTLNARELAQVQDVVIGIADAFGLDLQAAAELVGKTLGSTTNAMGRYGIEVDTTATQQAKLAQLVRQTADWLEIAKAKTQSTGGALAQLRNAWGDMQEEIGAVILEIISFDDTTASAGKRVFDFTDFLHRNQEVIAAWARVVLAAAKAAVEAMAAVMRAAFNLGQMIGGSAKLLLGLMTQNLGLIIAGSGEMKLRILEDIADIIDGFNRYGAAVEEVAARIGKAQLTKPGAGKPSGLPTTSANDAAKAAVDAAVAAGALTPGTYIGNVIFGGLAGIAETSAGGWMVPGRSTEGRGLPQRANAFGDAVNMPDYVTAPDMGRDPLAKLEQQLRDEMERFSEDILNIWGNLFQAIASGTEDMSRVVIGTVTEMVQAIIRQQASSIGPGAGLLGLGVGILGGIASEVFGRDDPVPVKVHEYGDRALQQLRDAQQAGTIILEQGVSVDTLARVLEELTGRRVLVRGRDAFNPNDLG